jgi:hypothetical protein
VQREIEQVAGARRGAQPVADPRPVLRDVRALAPGLERGEPALGGAGSREVLGHVARPRLELRRQDEGVLVLGQVAHGAERGELLAAVDDDLAHRAPPPQPALGEPPRRVLHRVDARREEPHIDDGARLVMEVDVEVLAAGLVQADTDAVTVVAPAGQIGDRAFVVEIAQARAHRVVPALAVALHQQRGDQPRQVWGAEAREPVHRDDSITANVVDPEPPRPVPRAGQGLASHAIDSWRSRARATAGDPFNGAR